MKDKILKFEGIIPLTFFTIEENVRPKLNKGVFAKSIKHKTSNYLLNNYYKSISLF